MAPLTECGAVDVRDQNMIYSKLLIIIIIIIIYIYIYIYICGVQVLKQILGGSVVAALYNWRNRWCVV